MSVSDPFTAWAQLASEVERLTKGSRRRHRGRFNLFTTLLKAGDEVRLHTRFIHSLLNRTGTHGAGDAFLRLFFETLAEHPPHDHQGRPVFGVMPPTQLLWSVDREVSRGEFGQLDLLLQSGRDNPALVIENKIFHHEGEAQISRYAKYLKNNHPHPHSCVLFLTLDGRPATTAGEADYLRISYPRHILAWLEKCIDQVRADPFVRPALIQYRSVVLELTGQALDHAAMQSIKEQIRHSPSIIRHRVQINAAIQQVRIDLAGDIAEAVRKQLADFFGLKPWKEKSVFEPGGNGCFLISPASDGPIGAAPFQLGFQYWTDQSIFLIGAFSDEKSREHNSSLFSLMLPELTGRALAQGIALTAPNGDMNWPLGWWELSSLRDDDTVANMLQDDAVHREAVRLCGQIKAYAALAKAAFNACRAVG